MKLEFLCWWLEGQNYKPSKTKRLLQAPYKENGLKITFFYQGIVFSVASIPDLKIQDKDKFSDASVCDYIGIHWLCLFRYNPIVCYLFKI